MGLDEKEMEAIRLGGPLHDVGKIGIPDEILLKPGRLSEGEMEEIKGHPRLGHRIVGKVRNLASALPLILHHHEYWDGSGYPDGLQGEEIPLVARIFAVVDAYDAMTSDRVYRRAMSKWKAMRELEAGAGSQFDPTVVRVMVEVLSDRAGSLEDPELIVQAR
jgi:HD-GYP domain-containing protein (c-di-GMP phosphodiesterase class II)